MQVDNPVILLLGKTGAGKSTLGNLLLEKPHDNGPFYASADMESVTKECHTETMSIGGVMYNIVDTPGIFDTQQATDAILKEIAKSVHKCAYGLKAILVVFESRRFTDEQKNVLNGIRTFLGKDATNHIIIVFSHATKAQISNNNEMQKAWNQPVRSFIQDIGNRWSISPNSDYFSPDDPIHKARLMEINEFISGIRGIYTTEQLEKNLLEQEKAQRRKEEEEKRIRQEYEKKLKENAKREAEEAHRRQLERIRQEQIAKQKYQENLRRKEQQEAEERHRQMIELMRQEREREENLRRREQQEAEERHRRTLELIRQEREARQEAEERHKRRLEEAERGAGVLGASVGANKGALTGIAAVCRFMGMF